MIMKSKLIIIILTILISVVNGNLPKKLYGGNLISIHRRPWQVSIQLHDYHICNGVIISEDKILTAASCVTSEPNILYANIQILSGTSDLLSPIDSPYRKIYKVAYIILHEEYNPHYFWINDIAILKLETQIQFNHMCKAATIPTVCTVRSRLKLTGWGLDPTTNNITRYLQQIEIQSLTSHTCKNKFYQQQDFHQSQFCSLPFFTTARITEGNGGSPITAGLSTLGIISLIPTKLFYPAIYTRVYHYLNWIDNIKNKI